MRKITGATLISLILLTGVIILPTMRDGSTPPILDDQGQRLLGSIASLEKIELGGTQQWILIRGKNVSNPVILSNQAKRTKPSELPMIKNILWDLDGTIFDSYPAITYAISKSLNEMGLSVALNVIDGLARQSIEYCLITLSQRFKLDPDLLRARFADSYETVDPVRQLPFPGVREVCQLIHQCGGLNIIVTHRGIRSTQKLLGVHGLASCFDDIFSVEEGYPRKPNPAMILAALEKHHLNPAETLLVGDREIDTQAGRASGISTCLFSPLELSAPADIHISHFNQLVERLSKIEEDQ